MDGQTDVTKYTCLSEGWDLGFKFGCGGWYDERAIACALRGRVVRGQPSLKGYVLTSGWKLLESSTNLARSEFGGGGFDQTTRTDPYYRHEVHYLPASQSKKFLEIPITTKVNIFRQFM